MEPMALLQGVGKTYETAQGDVHAVRDIALRIERGEFLAIMGPSGSGKSTLLALLGLLTTPSAGRLAVDGCETQVMSEAARTAFRSEKLGFVFQFPSLVNTLNVQENVLLPRMFAGRVSQAELRRAEQLLEQVGLQGRSRDRSYQLSGGQQRRVALARALMNDPVLLLADEPTGALDEDTAAEMLQLLKDVQSAGKTVVMVTHDKALAAHADRLVTIRDGVMVE